MRIVSPGVAAIVLLCIVLLPGYGFAQYDLGIGNSNFAGVRATLINPAAGADPKYTLDANVVSASVLFDNTFLYVPKGAVPAFGFKSIIDGIIHNDKFATYYNTAPQGKLYQFALTTEILGPSFQLALPNRQSVGFTFANRTAASVRDIPGTTAETAYGYLKDPSLWNKPLEDHSSRVNGMNWLEYGFHYSAVLLDDGTDQWNGGITLKYLQGVAAAYIHHTNLSYRVEDSTNLVFAGSVDYGRTDYDSYRHIGDYGDLNHGHGFGVDIGVQYKHADVLKLGLSIMDIGAIRYNRNAAAFHLQTSEAEFPGWGQLQLHSNLAVDRTLSAVFYSGDSTRSQVGTGFRMGLPTALSLQADYKLQDHVFLNATIVKGLGHGTGQGGVQPDIYSITPRYESAWWDVSVPLSLVYYGAWRPRVGLAVRAGYVFFGGDAPASLLALGRLRAVDFYTGVRFFLFDNKNRK